MAKRAAKNPPVVRGIWCLEGRDHHVEIFIDEHRLTDAITVAIGRHDGTKKLLGNAIIIVTRPVKAKGAGHVTPIPA